MEHWWSPERRGPPEGVPHRPLWNIGGRRSDVGHPKAFLTGHYGTLVVAEATVNADAG
ncbi:hypothetical protein A7C16_005113 [Escherichia coli]|nr:hypothetical protein [Escherichia coli]HCK1793382.1 hypothetical protein [Escherichia coli]HCP5597842.1 hypothetical protein [Escherichia coli]HCU0079911.1 hypothetical protein [Escherichia coli]HDI8679109.1 hypothetical protein [Escherichia coli]